MNTALPIQHLHLRDWQCVKRRLKEEFGSLTEADLTYTEGQFDRTLRRIAKKTGVARADIERIVQETCGCPGSDFHTS